MSRAPSHLWPGVPMALASAALFGASAPLAKRMLGDVDPWLMAALLYLGAGIGLAGVGILSRGLGRRNVEAPLRASDLPWLAAVVLAGGVAGPVLLMFGLARTDAASASLLLNLEGLTTLAIAWVVFRENVDSRLVAGALAILAGAGLLAWTGAGPAFDLGALFVAGACLAWGIDNNLTRKLSAADPTQITIIKGLVAGAVNLALALAQGAAMPPLSVVVIAGATGFVGYGVSLVLFVHALRHLGAARTGAYFALGPFIGAAIAVGLLGESMTTRLLAAGALMAVGLWLHLAERHDHAHVHEAMEHEHAHSHDAHHRHDHDPALPPGTRHSHRHRHGALAHRHRHYPDLHHRHAHEVASQVSSDERS